MHRSIILEMGTESLKKNWFWSPAQILIHQHHHSKKLLLYIKKNTGVEDWSSKEWLLDLCDAVDLRKSVDFDKKIPYPGFHVDIK